MQQAVKLIWASPCSLVGLVAASGVLLAGGRARRAAHTLEVVLPESSFGRKLVRWLPFVAITLGHVVIAVSGYALEHSRAHERVHVAQYERWGILFFPAYLASSLWQVVRGRRAYWDNYFEIQARERSAETRIRD